MSVLLAILGTQEPGRYRFLLGLMANDTVDEVQAAVDIGPQEDYSFTDGSEDWDWYFPDQVLDVVPQLFPPAVGLPIEIIAAQPTYGDLIEAPLEVEDYGTLPEQLEFLAPPEVPTSELEAAQFEALEDYYFVPEETDDYANDSLDVTPQLFPPFVQEPDSTFAAQPHYGDLFETYVPDETTDYAFAEQLEFLAPPEIVVPEIVASQPHFGEWLIEEAQTEDYANDATLDLTAFFFPTAVEPVETFASQPLAEQYLWPAEEIEDYLALPEQNEPFAPPEAPTTELAAAQPHYGEAFWPEAETEDYQSDATLDLTPTFFPTAQEAIEVFAAQPYYGEWTWDEEWAGEFVPLSALDVSPLFTDVPATLETLASAGYSTFHEIVDALIYESLEDYQNASVLEVAWFLAGAPVLGPDIRGPVFATPIGTGDTSEAIQLAVGATPQAGGGDALVLIGPDGLLRIESPNDAEAR